MNCPNCKFSGSLRFVRAGAFVECVTPGCGWCQVPLAELVCDAAVYTWHRENPTPAPDPETFVDYSIGLAHGWMEGPHWVIWKTTFSGKSQADPRKWERNDRASAQSALDAFKAERGVA